MDEKMDESQSSTGRRRRPSRQQAMGERPDSNLVLNVKENRTNVHTVRDPDAYKWNDNAFDNAYSIERFRKNFRVEIKSINPPQDPVDESEIEFDLIGCDPSIANALRRVLIAEVPTVAIHKVDMYQNTSIIQDEVFAHRLGLVPLNIDPRKMKDVPGRSELNQAGDDMNPSNTVVFSLQIACTRREGVLNTAPPGRKYINETVLSDKLLWECQDGQETMFDRKPAPLHPDILLAKMRPGQEIECAVYAVKGTGREHAKWSPVSTAWYRMLPSITFREDPKEGKLYVEGDEAEQLVKLCPKDVFDIEDLGSVRRAKVARPRECSMCRECIEGWSIENETGTLPEWITKKSIQLGQVKDHYIFRIESVGQYPAEELLGEAIEILLKKLDNFERELDMSHERPPLSS